MKAGLPPIDVRALFGSIDIYLFDQIQRGRIQPGMRIFDAGCGDGRNLAFFLQQGYEVWGIDADPTAIDSVQALVKQLAPGRAEGRFRCETLERHTFPAGSADVVIASAVFWWVHTSTRSSRPSRNTTRFMFSLGRRQS